ncbi:MAG TPA: ATP synthase F1 subunit gamma [Bacteroidales bacterium]|nr:ATP synthase F1 subunit gamma [Bacteroidales bacterium]
MPSLKEVRNRIASVNSTRQITSAMKMVAASKLRKAQNNIIRLKPYANKIYEILQDLYESTEDININFFNQRDVNKVLLVVISSNRGLCGSFNANIIKASQNFINEKLNIYYASDKLDIICIGKKASEFYIKKGYNVINSYNDIFDNVNYDSVSSVASSIMSDYESGKYDKVFVIYNYFKNAAVHLTTISQFLPFVFEKKANKPQKKMEYILEPTKQDVIKTLIPHTLKLKFYEYLLNSYVAEHGARMTAMHKATDNATELLKDLKLTYNKVRQAAITKEIIEIVGGANVLL